MNGTKFFFNLMNSTNLVSAIANKIDTYCAQENIERTQSKEQKKRMLEPHKVI